MGNTITAGLVGHVFREFIAMTLTLQKNIHNVFVLIDSAPQIVLLSADSHEYFVDVEPVSEPRVLAAKSHP